VFSFGFEVIQVCVSKRRKVKFEKRGDKMYTFNRNLLFLMGSFGFIVGNLNNEI